LDPQKGDISLPVDLIRTSAILLVILLHASIEPYPLVDLMSSQGVTLWWASNIYDSIARPCVPLFVMLTGALLLQPSKLDEPLRVFFKKRINRIALPFIFWGTAYFAWRFFVNHESLSFESIWQGILTGPYNHFWYLYILVGLYLVTPILRVLVAHADWKILKYFLLVWFIGTAIAPLIGLFNIGTLNGGVFIITGWIGYFLLGAYLQKVQLRSLTLYILLFAGYAWTILGTYIVTGSIGQRFSQFFYDAFSFNVIMVSIALFMLLRNVSSKNLEGRFSRTKSLLHTISMNTLPIYLLHVMLLESLQKGYFGFQISLTTMNPIVEVPLITAVTFFICLGLIYPLKKIPYVGRLIG
jgi:surface polysaccharide O-acyltransferase-like enzyme